MLTGLLRLPSATVATCVCLALLAVPVGADTGGQDRLPGLIAGLGDDDYHRREAAAVALA